MPTFEISAPNGKTYHVEGANAEGALAAVKSMTARAAPVGEAGAIGDPMGTTMPEAAPGGAMPYGEQMANVGGALDKSVRAVANGIPFMDRIAAAGGAATGIGGKFGDYSGNLERERATNEALNKEHPIASTAAGVVGGAMVPLGALGTATKAATTTGRILRGAGAGAAIGSAQGISDSPDLGDVRGTAKGAGIGALTGGVIGGSIAPVARGVGSIYSAIANRLGDHGDISRPALSELVKALRADGPDAVRGQIDRLGPYAMLPDAGPSLLGTAQGLAVKPGDAKSALVNALLDRNQGTNARLGSDVNAALGPAESPLARTQQITSDRSDVHKALPAIFEQSPPVDATGPVASIGLKLNKAVGPERTVLEKAKEYLTQEAENGSRIPVTDAERLHNANVALDKLIDYGDPGLGIVPGAVSKSQGAVADIRKQLNTALRDQVPGYGEVMDKSSALAKRAEAVEQGTGILDSGKTAVRPDDFAATLANRPEVVPDIAAGSRAEIDRQIGTKANDLQALKSTLQGEGGWNTAKLGMLHGEEPVSRVTGAVDREAKFRDTHNKVVENSQTAQRQGAAKSLKDKKPPELFARDTLYGDLKHLAKTPFKAAWRSLATGDNTGRDAELARILAAQGATRDKHLKALVEALARHDSNAATGTAIGNRAALGAALLGNDYQRDQWRAR